MRGWFVAAVDTTSAIVAAVNVTQVEARRVRLVFPPSPRFRHSAYTAYAQLTLQASCNTNCARGRREPQAVRIPTHGLSRPLRTAARMPPSFEFAGSGTGASADLGPESRRYQFDA
eukprot:9483155-Pyramimonas_sp.AAC.1